MQTEADARAIGIRDVLADRAVVTVVVLAFVMMVGTGLVLPILPLYARSFGVGYEDAGLLVSAYALARLLADLVSGALIDRLGERVAAALGLTVVSLGTCLTGLAPSFALAVVFWAGAGIGSAVVFAAMFSHLLKLVPKERMARTLSVFYGAFNGGVIAGGFLAGVIAHTLGLAAPLFFTAGVALLSAVLYLRYLPRRMATPAEPPALSREEALVEREIPVRRSGRATLAKVLRTPGLATVLAANFAYMWFVIAVFDTLVPLFASDELGMSTVGIGIVFAIALATEFAVLYPAGSIADRRGRRFVLVPSLAFLALVTASIGFAGSPVMLGLGMAVLGVASGFVGVPPGAMLSDIVEKESSATAVAVFRFCGDLGFTLGPLVAGFAAAHLDFRGAFGLAVAPMAVALVLAVRSAETLRRPAR